jgi:hypothetical protein
MWLRIAHGGRAHRRHHQDHRDRDLRLRPASLKTDILGHEPMGVGVGVRSGRGTDGQCRYIEATVSGVLIACLYAPNGNPQPGPRFAYKLAWLQLRATREACQNPDSNRRVEARVSPRRNLSGTRPLRWSDPLPAPWRVYGPILWWAWRWPSSCTCSSPSGGRARERAANSHRLEGHTLDQRTAVAAAVPADRVIDWIMAPRTLPTLARDRLRRRLL